jgi:hypothetical protein
VGVYITGAGVRLTLFITFNILYLKIFVNIFC